MISYSQIATYVASFPRITAHNMLYYANLSIDIEVKQCIDIHRNVKYDSIFRYPMQ